MGFGILVLLLAVALVVVAFLALHRRARHSGPEGTGGEPPAHPPIRTSDRPSETRHESDGQERERAR